MRTNIGIVATKMYIDGREIEVLNASISSSKSYSEAYSSPKKMRFNYSNSITLEVTENNPLDYFVKKAKQFKILKARQNLEKHMMD